MVVVALGIAVGPTVGGILTSTLGWRWIFYMNVPVGATVVLTAPPNSKTVMGAATPAEQGITAGILATGRTIGQGLSVAVAGAVFTSWGGAVAGRALSAGRSTLPVEQVQALQQTFVSALHAEFVVCAVLAAIGVVTALARGR